MRIVGGAARGKPIVAPKGLWTRPTTDRVRETIFNVLVHRFAHALEDGRVLDLFAGSGAMGLEALSRGAAFALFVDTSGAARAAIRINAETTGMTGKTRVWRRDASRLGLAAGAPFSLVFADPPYGQELGETALVTAAAEGWCAPGAVAVLEEAARRAPEAVTGWHREGARRIGDSTVTFLSLAT